MPRPRRRALLRGTMLVHGARRRRFLFRVDPEGLLAVRVGNPLAFSGFLAALLLAYVLGWGILGPASLLAGGAVGLAALGLLDNSIARMTAGQPRDAVLKSPMNLFLGREDLREATLKEGVHITRVEATHKGTAVVLDIVRPSPSEARRFLEPLLGGR